MHESLQTEHNEVNEDVARFEKMESGNTEYYFDVEDIENIFDFYTVNGQLENAERVLQLGLKLHPASISLLERKTYIFLEKGEEENAIPLMEELLKFEESDPCLYFNLGLSYLKTGKPNKSLSYYKKALANAYDEEEEIILDIANSLNQYEQYNEAIDFLEEGCEKYPKNEDLLFELAYAYDKKEMIDKSISIYIYLLEINPFVENAWYNLGILYNENEDYAKSVECYNYALAVNPAIKEALFNKANALMNLEEFHKALDCYIEYVSYGEDIILAYQYIAECLEQLELYDLSLRFYELTITKAPLDFFTWVDYLSLIISQKHTEKALEKTAEALKFTDEFPEFMYLRGKAFWLANDYQYAFFWIEKSIEISPDNFRYLYGWIQLKKEINPARDSWSLLEEWKPKYAGTSGFNYTAAAIAITELKDFDIAGVYLEDAFIDAPEDFDYFLDVFAIPENELLENENLKQLIIKYFDFE